jgi:hypothetical protein
MAAQEQIQFWKGIWQQGISYKYIQGFVFKNKLFVPLQTLEHPEVQKAEIKYVLGFLCASHLSCSRKDLAEK